jgi:hypothetical protein
MSTKGKDDATQRQVVVKKTVAKKGGPTEAIPVDLVTNKGVGDYLHLFVGGPKGIPSGAVLHHPIGITDLDDDTWVLSNPEDVRLLLSRSKDPRAAELNEKRAAFLRRQAVDQGLIGLDSAGELVLKDGTKRSDFLATLKKDATEINKDTKGWKYSADAVLAREDDVLAEQEKTYRAFLRSQSKVAEGKYPTVYRTMGGPMADIPQRPVFWLTAKTLAEVQTSVFMYGVTGPPVSQVANAAANSAPPAPVPTGDQWAFLPDEATQEEKKAFKDVFRKGKRSLEQKFGKENILVRFAWD